MTTELLFKNNSQSTLAGSISDSDTTANLAAGTGVRFPDPDIGQGYYGTFTDAATGLLREIVLVTDMTGDTITTMIRGQQGTAAQAWQANDLFAKLWTEGDAEALIQIVQAQQQSYSYDDTDSGSANNYIVNLTPAISTAPARGTPVRFKVANTNTGASTINAGWGAVAVRRGNGTAFVGNEFVAGNIVTVYWNGSVFIYPDVGIATDAVASAGTDTYSAVNPKQISALTIKTLVGQCYFQRNSATQCVLIPYNGGYVPCAGVNYLLPSGGITIGNTGVRINNVAAQNLLPNSEYLVAFDGTVLDFWTAVTGHSPSTFTGNIGVEVINGNNNRTLVGRVATDGSAQFVDTDGFIGVLSWFNRRKKRSRTYLSGTITGSTTLIELDSTARNYFMQWGSGAAIEFSNAGSVQAGGSGQLAMTTVGFDGVTPEPEAAVFSGMHTNTEGSSTVGMSNFSGTKLGLVEALHYATLLGVASTGTISWTTGTSTISSGTQPPNVLSICVMG